MAQGQAKKTKLPAPKNPSQRRQTGSRVIKPKKASLVQAKKDQKKHTSGLTALTEKQLAGRAGHLELLGGGKKESKAENAATKQLKKSK